MVSPGSSSAETRSTEPLGQALPSGHGELVVTRAAISAVRNDLHCRLVEIRCAQNLNYRLPGYLCKIRHTESALHELGCEVAAETEAAAEADSRSQADN